MSIIEALGALGPQSEFLAGLDPDDLAALSRSMQEVRRGAGEALFEAGSDGDRVYLLLEGLVSYEPSPSDASLSPREVRKPGELIGIAGFFSGSERSRTARCSEDCLLLALGQAEFNRLLEDRPETWSKLQVVGLERIRRDQLSKHLDRVFGPFGNLLPFVMQEVEENSEWLTLKSGETLYSVNDEPDGAYLLLAGRLLLEDADQLVKGTVLAGETVGEVALLTKRPRSATVYAARDSELVRFSSHMFELMLQRSSRAMYRVSGILANRLVHRRSEREASRTPIRTISLVPASDSAPTTGFAEELTSLLSTQGSVKSLSGDSVAAELGVSGIAQATEVEPMHMRLTEWLHQQEDLYRYLVYRADADWTPWTERCIRQADRLVVVADAASEPNLEELKNRLSGPRRRWSLLLLHPAETERPRGAARWLENSGAESVYHSRLGNRSDMARLARILSGHANGLVLGGGGARGFAHIGVLKALEELQIPVDMVGGTSIGAPIGGWVAQNRSAEETKQRALIAFHKLIDLTLPAVSMLHGKRISDAINGEAASWDIEDLWLPFFCVSTNLTTSRPVIHRRGNAARAVRASVSIPGILPPVPEEGELLVDGGVFNNLPIDVMRDMNPFGNVIAIDVAAARGPVAKVDHGLSVSGWRHFLDKVNPFRSAAPLPGIGATIMQSMMVGSTLTRERALRANLADLYLNIHVRGVSLLQFDQVEKAAALGYEQSIGPLREWVGNRSSES